MKKFYTFLTSLALLFLLAACSEADTQSAPENTGEMMTIEHQSGVTKVAKNPQRVAVFDFGSLDTLQALDVEIIGLPKANLPNFLSTYKDPKYLDFGNLKEPDFEALHAAKPDLIIIAGRQEPIYDQLAEIAPTINLNVDYNHYIDSVKEHVEILGELFKKESFTQPLITKLDGAIKATQEKAEATDKRGLIVLINDKKISAYGSNSRFGIIHDLLHVKQADEKIAVSTHGQSVSFEYIVKTNPDYLFVVDRSAVVGNSDSSAKQVLENDLVKTTNAYKEGKIFYLDPNVWYLSGGGVKSTLKMVEDIDKAL